MSRKVVSFLLLASLIMGVFSVSVGAETDDARLYSVYGNGMLFEQNKAAIFAGEGNPDSIIKVQLLNANYWPVRTGSSRVNSDGTFEVSFVAPAGSYEEYTVELTQDGDLFAKLDGVVFGELWLASGQSNMQFPLGQSVAGLEMMNINKKLSKWLRVCMEPAYPTYNGTNTIPVDPQNDIIGVTWINGEDYAVYNMSAVAYFFAEELMNELNVPVGIINSSLGGSSIRSWLSREAIDSDNVLKEKFINGGLYINRSDWNESQADIYLDMTANYNLRTHAYRNFRPSGLIWYQGETDLIYRIGTDVYAHSFDALQQMYTDMFDYGEEYFPIVYTQIAPFDYGEHALSDWNFNYTQMQSILPESRAMVTIYDLPLTYPESAGVIHPSTKQPVGERMAKAALGMVYGKNKTYTAATVKNYEIKNSSIYVTLNNVGDGIKSDDSFLNGFAISADDGIYVQAQAEIIDTNTVRIWNDDIQRPASASYACCTLNTYSSLYTTVDGEKFIPVSPFVTKVIPDAVYWTDKTWAECETDKAWHLLPDPHSAEFDTWKAEGAETELTNSSAYSGEKGLNITATNKNFTVKPVQLYTIDEGPKPFSDTETNWSNYGKISFMARNNSATDITLNAVRIYADAYRWYSPAISGTKDSSYVLPADGEWHEITLDLDSLYLFGNECGFTYANEKLTYTFKFELAFSSPESNANLSIDQFRFGASDAEAGTRYEADMSEADNIFEVISAMFTALIGFFANMFR
ncbi:MAG: hypothetical protein IIW48_07630 [Clostridia bacterium]|nr:hypothetical protein [Clostridia bacterium]